MRIDVVQGTDGGRIGLTHCPGSRADLSSDLQAIAAQPAALVISLLTQAELNAWGLTQFTQICARLNLPRLHIPIRDMHTPDPAFERQWQAQALIAHQVLRQDGLVVLHCAAGLGRAGMIGCRLLIEAGDAPAHALRLIRQARPGAVETAAQQAWVLALPPRYK